MQYGLNINKCEEIKKSKDIKTNLFTSLTIKTTGCIFVAGLLLGRVNLLLNNSDSKGIAPFGLAFLLAIVMKNSRKNDLIAGLGVGIGYFSIQDVLIDKYMYLFSVVVLTIIYMILKITRNRKKEIIGFGLILLSFFLYGMLINLYELGVNATLCLIETVVIIPIYYVIKYSIDSIDEIKINKTFSTEQMVSVGMLFCLLVAGIGNITVNDYSVKNIFALALVLCVAYVGGAAYGSMIGVAMGIILGVASNDMMACVGFYGVGGLVVGIFKDTGKIFSILSGIIIYLALGLYSNELTLKFGIEVISGCILFLCVPKSLLSKYESEVNLENRKSYTADAQLESIKDEVSIKLKQVTEVLTAVSKYLGDSNENENLLIKGKGSALVENLADRCCSKCENKSSCWEKDFNQTFNSFQGLIQSYEDGNIQLSRDLQRKCVKNFTLIKNTEAVVNNYAANETIKNRLAEGRRILAEHVRNVTDSVDGILDAFKKNVMIDSEMEKRVKKELNKMNIQYNNVFCYLDSDGKNKIKLSLDECNNIEYCNNNILQTLNKLTRKELYVSDEGNSINSEAKECIVTIEEAPKYSMVSYGAFMPKSGEVQTGDSYTFGKTSDGFYTTILSDGMGFGPEANKESKSTVELVEKFIEAGFDEDKTVNTVNSIMGMKFAEDEKYATLDLSKVNLYNGETTFVKIGAAPTFVKRGNIVKAVNSKNLPFGLVDEVDVEYIKGQLKAGDILVSVSDGVLDIDKVNSEKFIWLEEYLKQVNDDPKTLSEKILQKAKELSGKEIKDDMTVLVSKIYIA
ncbi:MAG: stage II sporulation protein E [Clostridium butyricum]|nr:stage II sporulation protein E [Clostridium butyricum]